MRVKECVGPRLFHRFLKFRLSDAHRPRQAYDEGRRPFESFYEVARYPTFDAREVLHIS